MKHMTFADKSFLLGDETAVAVLEYAAALAHHHDADDVELETISSDGDEVRATLLLGGGAPLMAESAHTELPEPDNADALAYMKRRIDALRHAPSANPLDPETHADSTYSEPDLTQS